MSTKRTRSCLIAIAGLGLLILIAVFVLYRIIRNRTDFRPLLGEGERAALNLPPDFEATVYAEGLAGPRFIAFGPDGALYAADRGNNRIVALPDEDGNGVADTVREFAIGLNQPHSLVYHQGAWYVGMPDGIFRIDDADGDGQADGRAERVNVLPASGSHRTRTVEFLPDGRMVVSVGSSCNVCIEEDERRATVLVYDGPEGGGEKIFAQGLRNAVGLAIHPETGDLWATNNGRDLMGDDIPPETIYIVEEGGHYGWPFCHSGTVIDPEFGGPDACQEVVQPVVQFQAHSAPLGLVFYTGEMFPAEYRGDLFVAYHGSWNRSVPTGYKVVRIPMADGLPAGPPEDFATGWLDEETGEAAGRPVGLAVGPDGALYVSDDKSGRIYRIVYVGGD